MTPPPESAARAEALRALQVPGDPLVLVNVWDVASALAVAATPGCRAIATGSHPISESLGFPDGEGTPLDEMLAVVARIAGAIELPLTADLEAGYGDAGKTASAAIAAGAIGLNLEDTDHSDASKPLFAIEAHQDAVRAVREAGARDGVRLVINARTDVLFRRPDAPDKVEQAIERGNAYMAAGADSIFVAGARDEETIRALVAGIDGPINVIAANGRWTVAELAAMGVARISLGPYPHRMAMAHTSALAADVYSNGAFGLLDPSSG